mmetsp:Transcript_97548/g.303846  ORF Transcript_97548/g.303846 Transcript_97548/m.303846 type:complete len:293 (+) Transcript_97548:33-911(+)
MASAKVCAQPVDGDSGPGLWLGDESWAVDPAMLRAMSITHCLRCNMREAEAQRWMAEQWCDCPACPRPGLPRFAFDVSPEPFAMTADGNAPVDGSAPAKGSEQADDGPPAWEVRDDPSLHNGGVPAPPPPWPGGLVVADPGASSAADGAGAGAVIHGYLPLFDDDPFAREHAAPLLQEGARFIHEALDLSGGRVYVHCEKGCSRSVSVVAQYLVEFRSLSLPEVATLLKARRCRASPNGGFIDALARNERMLGGPDSSCEGAAEEALAAFRRPWLADFRAGRVRPRPVDRIL